MCRFDPWHNPSATALLLYSDGERTGTLTHREKKKGKEEKKNIRNIRKMYKTFM